MSSECVEREDRLTICIDAGYMRPSYEFQIWYVVESIMVRRERSLRLAFIVGRTTAACTKIFTFLAPARDFLSTIKEMGHIELTSIHTLRFF